MRRLLALLVALAIALGAAPALAQGEAPPSPEHDAVFKSGLDQYSHGNYVAAIATWESLLTTLGEDRGYKVLYNLGLAYQQIGDTTKAIERFGAFERQIEKRPQAPAELAERARDAAQRRKQLEESHGAVNILAPKRGGLVLTRVGNGEPRAAGYVVWLAPGTHTIELYVGTDHVKRVEVEVEPGASREIETTPENVEPPPSPPAPPQEPQNERPTATVPTIVWIGAAATVVSLALPATLYVVANDKRDAADALGAGHTSYASKRSTYEAWRTGYYVSYALPATLALVTAALYVLRPTETRAKPASSARIGVGPGNVLVTGDF